CALPIYIRGETAVLVPLLPPVFGDGVDLVVRDKHTLHTQRGGGVWRLVEHVAASEQFLGARLVEDHARVYRRCDRERDARREVRLDQPGDDVYAGALRADDQVDTRRSRHLRQTRQQALRLV